MSFFQLRLFFGTLLTAMIVITTFVARLSPESIFCAIISLGGAAWITYWMPPFIIYMQEKYGLEKIL